MPQASRDSAAGSPGRAPGASNRRIRPGAGEHLSQWTSDGVWNDAAVAGSIGSSHGVRQPVPI
jgi:hypothetical protein